MRFHLRVAFRRASLFSPGSDWSPESAASTPTRVDSGSFRAGVNNLTWPRATPVHDPLDVFSAQLQAGGQPSMTTPTPPPWIPLRS